METAFMLYHGASWKAESANLRWLRSEAMTFHQSRLCDDVFILPRRVWA